MRLVTEKFAGRCSCGQSHTIDVKKIIIESNAAAELEQDLNLDKYQYPVIICDENTFAATEDKLTCIYRTYSKIQLSSSGLHANNDAIELIENQWDTDTDVILAIGSGTIHDLSRYIAKEKNIPFISVPTAASVDGFVSTVAAMTWNGLKKTFPAVSPIAVYADLDIIKNAPYRLTASGVSDLLGKFTALVDWKISNIITAEPICMSIYEMEEEAVKEVCGCINDLGQGKETAYEKLMYALLLSGLAMQMIGNSRPASGAEHHISHLWEMEVINKHVEALHGEKVSVGLIHVLDKYDQIKRAIQLNRCEVVKNEGIEAILLKNTFGKKGLLEGIMEENTPDPLAKVDENHLRKVLPEIAHVLESMPDKQVVLEWLKRAGSVTEMKQVGLEEDILPLTLKLSPYVRNRLTLMRLSKMLVLH